MIIFVDTCHESCHHPIPYFPAGMEQFVFDVSTIYNCELLIASKTSHLSTQKLTALGHAVTHHSSFWNSTPTVNRTLMTHAANSGGVNNMIRVVNVDYYHCRYDVTLSQAGTQPQHSSGDHFDSSGAWHGNIACKLLWVVSVSCPSLRSDHKHGRSAATSPLLHVSRISIATVMSEQWGPNKEASGDQVCRAGPGWGLS